MTLAPAMLTRLLMGTVLASLWSVNVCSSQGRDTLRLTLAEAERRALQHNPRLAEPQASLEFARAKRTAASHARFLPTFTLRNVWGTIPRARGVFTPTGVLTSPDTMTGLSDLGVFTQVDVDILQPLLTFGKLSNLTAAADFGVEAGEAGVAATEAEVLLQVRNLYWGLLLGYDLQEVTEDALGEIAKAQDRLQTKLDEGSDEVSQNDLFKLQIFRYEVDKRHRDVLDRIESAKHALRAATGIDQAVPFDLAAHSLTPLELTLDSLPEYLEMALQSRPDLAQLAAGVHARSSLASAAASDFWPQLFLGAQIKYNWAPNRFDPSNPFANNPTNFFRPGVVLGLNWNLNFFQTRDRVRTARFEESVLAARAPLVEHGIRLEVEKAYLAVKHADQDIRESLKALQASDNWLRSEAQTFDLGISDVKDFIDAFRANGTMRAEHAESILSFNTSLAALSKAVGRDLYPH